MHKHIASFVLAAGLASLAACHDHGSGVGREPDEYVGCATDELWATFDDAHDVDSPIAAPVLTAPTSATLPSTPVDFTWKQTASIDGSPDGDVPSSCEGYTTGYTTLHLAPISGTVYDLQISVGGEVKHRVITTLQKWTASAATWSALAGQPISLRLRRMVVLNNERKQGPFATTASFTVSK